MAPILTVVIVTISECRAVEWRADAATLATGPSPRLGTAPASGEVKSMSGMKTPQRLLRRLQARQDSNLQPPVLETGALPIELRA